MTDALPNHETSPAPAPVDVTLEVIASSPASASNSVPTSGTEPAVVAQQTMPVYAQPAPAYAQHAQPPIYIIQKPPATKKGFGITSMILGISALIFSWTTIFAFILLVVGFIFGIVSLKRGESPRGFAITGLVLGSIAVVVVIVIAIVIAMIAAAVAGTATYGY